MREVDVFQGFMYLLIYASIHDKLQFCMLCLKHVSEMFVAAKRFQVSNASLHVFSSVH